MKQDGSDGSKGADGGEELEASQDTARPLTPQARRALREAEARRKAMAAPARPREIGGRDGPDPVRYGDWEKDGIISDF
ncbi:MAG: DUF1674 domain-containing protein [Methyloligellaceae bacterium]